MKKLVVFVSLALMLCGIMYAAGPDIEAEGRGLTEYEASQQALMNLASELEVNVKTFTGGAEVFSEGSGGGTGDSELISDVLITTNVTISGARFKSTPPKDKNDPWVVVASMSFSISRDLYLRKIQHISRDINSLAATVSPDMAVSLQEQYYREISRLLDEYRKYSTIASYMGAKAADLPPLGVKGPEIKARLQEILARVDSIDRLALKVAKDLAAQGEFPGRVVVAMPLKSGSTKTTSLGLALQSRLVSALVRYGFKVLDDPKGAGYVIKTTYSTGADSNKQGILILSVLVVDALGDDAGQTVRSVSLTVPLAIVKEYPNE